MASKGKIEAGARAMRSALLKRLQANTELMFWDDISSARKEAYLEDAEVCIDAAEFVAGEEKIKAGAQALHASAVKRALRNGNELAPWEDLWWEKKFEYREDAEACINAANNVSIHNSLKRLDAKIEVGAMAIWCSMVVPPSETYLWDCVPEVQKWDYREQAEACIDAANNVSIHNNSLEPQEEKIEAGAKAIWSSRMRQPPSEEFLCLTKVQQLNYREQAKACLGAANKVTIRNPPERSEVYSRRSSAMTKAEKKLLRNVIRNVAHHDKDRWWELKREIFDRGYQPEYYSLGDYLRPAEFELKHLSVPEQQALIGEWRKANPTNVELSNLQIVLGYVFPILQEVVERARSAAYRTNNW